MSLINSDDQHMSSDNGFATRNDIIRLEGKLDKLVDAMQKLVLFEERQVTHAASLKDLHDELTDLRKTEIEAMKKSVLDLEKKVDMWIIRGMTTWFLATSAMGIYVTFFKH